MRFTPDNIKNNITGVSTMPKKIFMMMMIMIIIKTIIVNIITKYYNDSNKINMCDQLTDRKTKCLTRGIICLRLLLIITNSGLGTVCTHLYDFWSWRARIVHAYHI